MRYVTTPEQVLIPYSANNPGRIVIGARSSWIVGLILSLELAKTDAGGPTTYQDWLWRAVKAIRLEGGKRVYLNVGSPDARIFYWANRLRLSGRNRAPDMAAGGQTFVHEIPFLFTPAPIRSDDHKDNYSTLAGIEPDTDLTLTVTWGDTTALGSNRTVGAGTLLRATYLEAIPQSPEEQPKYYPQWASTTYNPPQSYVNQGGSIIMDAGLWHRRSHIMVLKGANPADLRTDGRAGDAVSEVAIKASDGRSPHIWKTWDFAANSQGQHNVADDNTGVPGAAAAYGAATVAASYNPGVGTIDWVAGGDPAMVDGIWGVDMRNARENALRIGLTVDNPSNVTVVALHESYQQYPA